MHDNNTILKDDCVTPQYCILWLKKGHTVHKQILISLIIGPATHIYRKLLIINTTLSRQGSSNVLTPSVMSCQDNTPLRASNEKFGGKQVVSTQLLGQQPGACDGATSKTLFIRSIRLQLFGRPTMRGHPGDGSNTSPRLNHQAPWQQSVGGCCNVILPS